jgi:regulator of protease activity HflC (stomatin/prohibitin superfamily)
VVSFEDQPVITEDNLVVHIDTVLFFQVTDPRAADYEIVDYATAIEQLCATMLRSVIGSMDLEQTLTSRDRINTMLRGVLDEASGKWGIRVTRVEIKALDPAATIMDAMEKQYRAQREKRAAILVAEGEKQAAVLKSEGEAAAIEKVFKAIHDGHPDPELLAYQYVQALPKVAQSQGSTVWVIPSEVTTALRTLSSAFGNSHEGPGVSRGPDVPPPGPRPVPGIPGVRPAGDGGHMGGKPENGGEPGTGVPPKAA